MRFAAHGSSAAHDALGEVLDVDEAARLQAVAGDRQRLAGEGAADHRRDDGRRPRARAVRDAEAQHRVLEPVELRVGAAVELARELGGRVQMRGMLERRVLVDDREIGVGVDPDRRGVDDSIDLGGPCGFEHGGGPAGVDALGAERIGPHLIDVRGGCEVGDRVTVAQRGGEPVGVAEIADHDLDIRVPGRGTEVVDDRLVTRAHEGVDDVGADEARPARHQHASHQLSSGR